MGLVEAVKTAGTSVAGAAGALGGTQIVLGFLGFTKAGVALGSFAAATQGPAVAAGSWFAICQAAGAAGITAVGAPAVGVAVIGAATAVGIRHLIR